MYVIRIPYPPPNTEVHELTSLDAKSVDFPERRLSYMIVGCKPADWQRCALEVEKAVALHSPGTEPDRLEIRISVST